MTAMTILPAGEPGAAERFEALYRSCAGDAYAYVASLLHDRSAAEDVTALAFERAYRRRAIYDVRRGSARAWLFAIARNAALDELRRRRLSTAELGRVLGCSESNAGTRLHRAIEHLREACGAA